MPEYAPLPDLPPPDVVRTLDLETILAELRDRFAALHPEHDALIESDPAHKLIEAACYREVILRQRVNDAARANLLAFAMGADLDHLAAFYGVERLTGEDDERLRGRTRARIIGFSTAGTVAGYRYYALAAHPDIQDVGVFPITSGPDRGLITIALLPESGGDEAAMLEAATEALNDPAVKGAVDTLEVRLATIVPVTVAATVTLRTAATDARVAEIEDLFRAAFDTQRGLGWDVTRSWITANLHRGGVHSVVLSAPVADIAITPDQYPVLQSLTLTLAGRAD